MRCLFFIRFETACVVAAFILALPIVAFAAEKLKDRSPDGQFSMSLKDEEDHEVSITLVETKTHKFVQKLSDSGHPYSDGARILWSPDSKRFAYCEENRKGKLTQLYIRKDSSFEDVELPDLPECDHPELDGSIYSYLTPKSWVKPDTLVLVAHDEWTTEDRKAHECDRTVTIAIDSSGKASIQSIQENKKQ
jgi:membrane-bound inhibitor of C-type lysozyme